MSFTVIYSDQSKYSTSTYLQPSSVSYDANIHSGFALCKLVQTYQIGARDITEAIYQFPVDYNSAFCELIIRTPREEIRGFVKEKAEANKIYSDAKKQGRQAFLTEESESDRDIYKLSMCNINQGDKIIIEYTYIAELEYSEGSNIFYIPSFISPRYKGISIPDPTHCISSKIRIGNDPAKLQCSMPNISISVENGALVLEHKSKEVLDNDIEIKFNIDYDPKAYKFESSGCTMAMMQFIPQSDTINLGSTKEIVFVLDCSGSMQGDRIENSKKAIIHCLEKMTNESNYKFNIMRYGCTCQTYSLSMLPNTKENIAQAINYCQNIKADLGGTETNRALSTCLDICKTAILITDGDTSNNQTLHNLCKKFVCLSILGIGSGINRANIKDAAKNGSGIARFSQNDLDIIKNIDALFKSITKRSIKNYKIDWANNDNSISSTRPVVFDEYITLYSVLYQNSEINRFTMAEAGIDMDFCSYNLPFDVKHIGALVAKRIIQENEISEFFTKEKLVDLAAKFNIITEYTSMVAVSNKLPTNFGPDHSAYEAIQISPDDVVCELPDINHDPNQSQTLQNILSVYSMRPTPISMQSTMYQDCSLYSAMISDPNDVVCSASNPISDLRKRYQNNSFYEPSDMSRTTIRETTVNIPWNTTVTPVNQTQTYNRYDRCTIKENIHDSGLFDIAKFNSAFDLIKPTNNNCTNAKQNHDNKILHKQITEQFIKQMNNFNGNNDYIKQFGIIFNNMKLQQIPITILNYFNEATGRFSVNINQILPLLPNDLLNDTYKLTLFILYCLLELKMVEMYEKCYNSVEINSRFD